MYSFLITLMGFFLRLFYINKPEGLWNDEYVSWMTASVPFGQGFWHAITEQCHMPLYYMYLKPFVNCSDIVLRLTSVIPSVIAIPVMYLIGKEYSKKTGYFCAAITSVLPFLIYYSQEVRFYSLVFLFSSLIFLISIKIIKYGNKKYYTLYAIIALLLILTHHLSIIFLTFLTGYLIYKTKKITKSGIIFSFLCLAIILPFGIHILKQLPSAQWWNTFSYKNLFFMFTDFFSPILTNNITTPENLFYIKNPLFISLMIIPAIIAVWGILKTFKKAKGYNLIWFGTVFIMAVLASQNVVVFLTKYIIEVLPLMILLVVLGLQNKQKNLLLTLFVIIQILSVLTPYHPSKIYRAEGNKIVGDILNYTKPDVTLFTYYAPDRFTRYRTSTSKDFYISKINRFEYADNPQNILKDVKNGEKVSFIFLNTVTFIQPESKNNNEIEMFVTFSKIKNKLFEYIYSNYTDINVTRQGCWTIITAVKNL